MTEPNNEEQHEYMLVQPTEEEIALMQLVLEREEAEKKTADVRLEYVRLQMRPHMAYSATVVRTETGFRCFIDDQESDLGEPFYADGDTPAEACDNFDQLWIYGLP